MKACITMKVVNKYPSACDVELAQLSLQVSVGLQLENSLRFELKIPDSIYKFSTEVLQNKYLRDLRLEIGRSFALRLCNFAVKDRHGQT